MRAAPLFALFALFAVAIAGRARAAESGPVTVIFVGDIMLDGLPGASIQAGVDPFERFASELSRADAAVGNLECAVATGGAPVEKIYNFRADPRVLPVLARHFAAVTLANNHSGDYGPSALLETMAGLRHAELPFFGAGKDLSEAHRAVFLERRGVKIALLGYDEFLPRQFEASASSPGVAWSEDEEVVSDIRAARAAGADIVIPFMHWGWEFEPAPCPRQRELAHRMLDAGADAVIGSHPHVTQGAEYYRGKPILYSLGNFVFDGFDAPEARVGWLATLTLTKTGVVAFSTELARLDERGLPAPDPTTPSPCGRAGVIQSCRTGQP